MQWQYAVPSVTKTVIAPRFVGKEPLPPQQG